MLGVLKIDVELRKMLDLLLLNSQCHFPHCPYPNCRKVKGLLRHGIQCKIRLSRGCVLCKKMWYLLQLHARAYKDSSDCHVPRCRDLKQHLRRLQQQSDSQRRAAVMERMRQQAEESKETCASGDWFRMGSFSSRRFELLNRMSLLPHEEILRKEAMLPCTSVELEDPTIPLQILSLTISLNITLFTHGIIVCNICKSDCYVAYLSYNCYANAVCLRHGCEINFEWVDVSVEQITYEKTPNASSPIASYLDSSMKPKYNLSTGVNEEL
ncbi:hypothetical protein T459_13967 [Capsicum annuum]|uniref:histone acetyltransferase n=1 Tax=Capsicum annuum TaxID=4072 RepID=A0A2G2ZG26_CAPAN|nr:hypothetical protein T459_13967 [Capsicum annuum]